jgi:hypothetical protein
MSKVGTRVQWEMFVDSNFYDCWAVRPIGDKDFNSPRLFHFFEKEDAEKFKELVEKSYHAVKNN